MAFCKYCGTCLHCGAGLRCPSSPDGVHVPEREHRPSWDEYFIGIAHLVARRSTCRRRVVGAVLVRDKRILTTGYNGAPSGLPHCLDGTCLREELKIPSGQRDEICRGIHAEQNAVIQAGYHGISTAGATLYCTTFPCAICAKMMVNAGIKRVVFDEEYGSHRAHSTMASGGIEVTQYRPGD